jgi:hypothetical protein
MHCPCTRHLMQKHKFSVRCPSVIFIETTLGPPKHENSCVDISYPGCTEMHYVTRRSNRMQKHMFGVACPRRPFMETALGPTVHEKLCVDIWCPRRSGMHCVTHRFHRMQKHKFGVTCPDAFYRNHTGPTRA